MTPTKFLSGTTASSCSLTSSGRKETAMSAEAASHCTNHPLEWSKKEDCALLQMMEQIGSAPSPSTWNILCRASQAPRGLRQRSHVEAWSRYQALTQRSREHYSRPQASKCKGVRATSQPLADEGLNEPIGAAASKVGLAKPRSSAAPVAVVKQSGRAAETSQQRREEEAKEAEGSGDNAKEGDGAAASTHEWTQGEDSLLLRLLAMRWGTTAYPSSFRFSWECLNCDIERPCRRSDAEIRERCEKLIEDLEGSRKGLVAQPDAVGGEGEMPSPDQSLGQEQVQQRQPHKKKTRTKKLSKKATSGKKGHKKSSHGLSIRGDFTSLRVEKTRFKGSSKITVKGKGALRLRL